jgi:hypothetical protein
MLRWDGTKSSCALTLLIAFSSISPLVSRASAQQAPAAAPTSEARDRARIAYGSGQTAFRAGNFAEALTQFETAYAAVPNPIVFKSIAECHERLGHVREAVTAFERYLNETTSINDRAAIEARVAGLRSRPGRLAIATTPTGASISVDGTSRGGAPLALELAPGEHTVVVSATGRESVTRNVTLSFADEQSLAIELPSIVVAATPAPTAPVATTTTTSTETTETAAAESTETDDEARASDAIAEAANAGPSDGMKIAMWSAVGVGAVGLVSGSVLGFLALGAQRDFDDEPLQATADKGRDYAIFADMSFLIAAGGALTALTLFLTEGQEAPAAEGADGATASRDSVRWSVAPIAAPNAGGLTARVDF